MNTIGSYSFPYSNTEYNYRSNAGNWEGGWVSTNQGIIYYNRYNSSYTGNMRKEHPVPFSFYEEMFSNLYWNGGWVSEANVLHYISMNGTQYNGDTGNNENNPWPEYAYEEMSQNALWYGGWVLYSDESLHYIPELEVTEGSVYYGSGSGSVISGSGSAISGSGFDSGEDPILGKGIIAGNGLIGTLKNGAFKLEVYWTDGNTIGGANLSEVSFSLSVIDSSYQLIGSSFTSSWDGAYGVSFSGDFNYMINEEIRHCYILDGSFIVPEQYRVENINY